MNIDQLEAFMYVVHLKSIHKAAKALYLSQPTVTARIKSLENELNTELFTREGKGLVLTQHGKDFIPYAQQILQTVKDGKRKLHKQKTQTEITFGANRITSQYFIPNALSKWRNENPNLKFKFISSTNDGLITMLLNHEIDFAFMMDITNEGIHQEKVLNNDIGLIVYPGHPFTKKKEVTIKELALESQVFFECGAFDWELIYKLFEVEKVEPKIDLKVDQLEVAKALIQNKQCVGFLPYLSVKEEIAKGELCIVNTTNLLQINQHIYLSYIQENTVNTLRKSIMESIQQFQTDQLFLSH